MYICYVCVNMNCIINPSVMHLYNSVRLFHTSLRLADISKTMNKVLNRTRVKNKVLPVSEAEILSNVRKLDPTESFEMSPSPRIELKFRYYETPLPSPTSFSKGSIEGGQSVNSKRSNVLNKLFMRYITDLMATGECAQYFVGHGIEVSRVKVSPDFCSVNIYWIAKGTEKDDIIDNILKTHVGALRHELAQLNIVGVIPQFQFVKDKQFAITAELDRLLAIADFGEDHIPLDLVSKLTTQLELNTTLDPQTLNKIQSLDSTDEHSEDVSEEPLLPMPQNVFNLNHSEIMNRILKSNKKVLQQSILKNESDTFATTNENAITFADEQEERQTFRDFLRKRQILKDEAGSLDKNYEPGLEHLRKEWYEQQQQYDNFKDAVEKLDYIEEEQE